MAAETHGQVRKQHNLSCQDGVALQACVICGTQLFCFNVAENRPIAPNTVGITPERVLFLIVNQTEMSCQDNVTPSALHVQYNSLHALLRKKETSNASNTTS